MASVHANWEEIIRRCGEEWIIEDFAGSRQAAVESLQTRIDKARDWSNQHPAEDIPELFLENIADLAELDVHKAQAFLQGLRRASSPQILVMVWRIIHGQVIESIRMEYDRKESFILRVGLSGGHDSPIQNFESNHIFDVRLLSHLVPSEINHKPLFVGFYALRH